MSTDTYGRLPRLLTILAIQIAALTGCISVSDPESTTREVRVTIEMIAPIRALMHEGSSLQFVTLRDARALAGLEGIDDGGPAHALLVTIYNPTNETLLLSSWGFDQMFVHHMVMRNGPWDTWRFFNTWEHVELGAPVYLVPVPALQSKRWVYTLPCTRLGPVGSHQSQALHLPASLTYEFVDGATVMARPLQGALLGAPIEVRVTGRGKAALSPDGLLPWGGPEADSTSSANVID